MDDSHDDKGDWQARIAEARVWSSEAMRSAAEGHAKLMSARAVLEKVIAAGYSPLDAGAHQLLEALDARMKELEDLGLSAARTGANLDVIGPQKLN